MNVTNLLARLQAALGDRYRIERELGQGGTAFVYLAEDLKHQRKVALKVLRPELAAVLGAQRFVQEIRTTASLQHSHILPLFDSGEADGFLYYVMPYVEGETLRDKLNHETQLSVEEAVRITTEMADALQYAHERGVIHRDIKPENVLLQHGRPMVADFGIALALSAAARGDRLTETGLSLGTPQYMSPEQATGERQIDARSDVYSLGAVLYEMLAGDPPVTGPTAQAMIAKLLAERPTPLRVVRRSVPEHVEQAVSRALAKVPADRFADAGAFAAALAAPAAHGRRRWHLTELALGAGAMAVVAVVAVVAWRALAGASSTIALGRSQQFTSDPGLEIQPAISPDGRLVAYSAGNSSQMRIFIRPVAGGRTIPLSDDSTAVETHARWAPDGNRLLFLTHQGVSVAPALGGSSRPVAPGSAATEISTATWSPDGQTIAFARGDSLYTVPASGGAERLLARSESLHSCRWSPDGEWIACVSLNKESVRPGLGFGNLAPSAIVLVPAGGGEVREVVEPRAFNQSPAWTPDGRQLLFLSNREGPRDVYALELSRDGRPRGRATRLTTGLDAVSFSLSADGSRLSYAVYSARANIWSLPIPTSGITTDAAATQLTEGSQVIEAMGVSPDGRWLLYDSNREGNSDIYRISIAGGAPEQLTADPADEFAGDLSPDGRAIAYHSWRTGTRDIEIKPLDGGPIVRVTETDAQESYPVWAPDGDALLFFDQTVPYSVYVVRRRPAGVWDTPVLLASPGQRARWSPDGTLIAYLEAPSHDRPGPIVVLPAAGGAPRRLFTPGPTAPPAAQVAWSSDGRTIYYKAHDASGLASFWSVSTAGGMPRLLVRFPDPDRQSNRQDFAADGKRLYFAIEDRQSDVFVAEVISQ